MQMCPNCDNVYDESDYGYCPYCSGELEDPMKDAKIKDCPKCGCIMYWDSYWECSNCAFTIDTNEDDYDYILE